MSLITSRLSLTQRCTIERDANAGNDDSWGEGNATPDWQPHITDLPCRAWATGGTETVTRTDTIAAIGDVTVIVPLGTDVTEQDRVASVTFRGDTIQQGPLGIRAINSRRDYLELILVKAS